MNITKHTTTVTKKHIANNMRILSALFSFCVFMAIFGVSTVFAGKTTTGATVTIKDQVQYSSAYPSSDIVKLSGKVNGANVVMYSTATKPALSTKSGIKIATFTFTFHGIAIPVNQTPANPKPIPKTVYSPIPKGTYTAESYADAVTAKVTVNAAGAGSATIYDNQKIYNASTGLMTASQFPFWPVDSATNYSNAATLSSVAKATSTKTTTTPKNVNPSCETQPDQVLSWFMCPLINAMASASQGIFVHIVQPLLQMQPIDVAPGNPIYVAWSNFRIYGDIALVIALLVMVFGEAIGGGVVSAYTVKKVLPRLLVAAVLLNLSIYIVAMAVDVTNIIGKDIGQLILTPFANSTGTAVKLSTVSGIFGVLAGIGTTAAIWGAGIAFLPLFLLFVLLPALFTMVAILITIVIRQAIIILLVIIAPVAFALYCLPNTERYFKQWWDTLLKTLLVYPIVSIIFAAAEVTSLVMGQILSKTSDQVTKELANILSFVAMMIPLFLIPFSFKISGGLVGSLYGSLNNLGKKAQSLIKGNPNDLESLQNRTKREAMAKLAEHNLSPRAINTRLNPTTLFGRRRQTKRLPKLASTRETYQGIYGKQGMSAQAYEQNKDKSEVMGDLALYGSSEESIKAATQAHERDLMRADENYNDNLRSTHAVLQNRLDSGEITQAQFNQEKLASDNNLKMEHNQNIQRAHDNYRQRLTASATADIIGRNKYMRRRALMNPATIGYVLENNEEGWGKATSVMREIAGDDVNMYRSMINEFQFIAKNVGRSDLSGNADSDVYDLQRAWNSQSLGQMAANSKPIAIKGFAEAYRKQMIDSVMQLNNTSPADVTKRTLLEKKVTDSLRFYKELPTMLASQPTGGNRDAIVEAIRNFKAANVETILANTTSTGQTFNSVSSEGVRKYEPTFNRDNPSQQNEGVGGQEP